MKVQVGLIKCSTSALRAPQGRAEFKSFVSHVGGIASAPLSLRALLNSAPDIIFFFQGGHVSADQLTICELRLHAPTPLPFLILLLL